MKFIEGICALGQARLIIILGAMIFSAIGTFIWMMIKYSQGETYASEFILVIIFLILSIVSFFYFRRQQNLLNQIEMEEKKLDKERRQAILDQIEKKK